MTRTPATVRLTEALVVVNIVIWLAFAAVVAIGGHPSYREPGLLRVLMAVIGAVAAVLLAVAAAGHRRRNRFGYWLLVGLLSVQFVAGFLDDLGPADFVFLLVTLAPLALLVRDRAWYLTPSASRPELPAS